MNRFKIVPGSINNYFAVCNFNSNNIRSRNGMDAISGFNWYQKGGCMVEVDRILHIAEKALTFQRFGKITEYVKAHSFI
ncbi:hypothetical protein [Roseburia inulinivorans]